MMSRTAGAVWLRMTTDGQPQVAINRRGNAMKLPMPPVALAELLSQPVVAKLATLTADGGIRMTPIWFEAEADGTFLMATWEATAAVRNIRARPRCSLLIDVEVAEP